MILGLHGVAGAGKDTIAKYLVEEHGWVRLAFADAIRDALYTLNPLVPYWDGHFPVASVVDKVGWDEAKKTPEIRRLLQVFGTEVGRNQLGIRIWVDALEMKMQSLADSVGKLPHIVITDVRFMDELYWLESMNGLSMKVKRPGYGSVNSHISDAGLPDKHFDYLVPNSGDLPALHHIIEQTLEMEKARLW